MKIELKPIAWNKSIVVYAETKRDVLLLSDPFVRRILDDLLLSHAKELYLVKDYSVDLSDLNKTLKEKLVNFKLLDHEYPNEVVRAIRYAYDEKFYVYGNRLQRVNVYKGQVFNNRRINSWDEYYGCTFYYDEDYAQQNPECFTGVVFEDCSFRTNFYVEYIEDTIIKNCGKSAKFIFLGKPIFIGDTQNITMRCLESLMYLDLFDVIFFTGTDTKLLLDSSKLFCTFKNVKELYLSHCGLRELPLPICYMRQLETLDISNNPINNIPIQFVDLQELKNLNISYTGLANFGSSLHGLNLENLSIAMNDGTYLFNSDMEAFSNLKRLNTTDKFLASEVWKPTENFQRESCRGTLREVLAKDYPDVEVSIVA